MPNVDALTTMILEKMQPIIDELARAQVAALRRASGPLTPERIPTGAIGPDKLSFDVATQGELEAHTQLVASVTTLGNVKIDGVTIGVNAQGQLYVLSAPGGGSGGAQPFHTVYTNAGDVALRNDGGIITARN